jgi:hypothetical protein
MTIVMEVIGIMEMVLAAQTVVYLIINIANMKIKPVQTQMHQTVFLK